MWYSLWVQVLFHFKPFFLLNSFSLMEDFAVFSSIFMKLSNFFKLWLRVLADEVH